MPLKTTMRISTRNQIKGTVLEVKKGPIDAIVTLEISNGNRISAVIPADAVERMSLAASIPAYAIVSSFVVMLAVDPVEMKLSTANYLKGTITAIEKGPLNANVALDVGGGNTLHATVAIEAMEQLGLVVGKSVYAIISAYMVMLGVDPSEQVWDWGH